VLAQSITNLTTPSKGDAFVPRDSIA
jgi:hypothetical protein